MTHIAKSIAPDLSAPPATLVFPGLDAGPPPEWAAHWADSDPQVVLVRHDDPHHALPAVREFETAHLILANPGAVVVGEGLGATVLLRLFAAWQNLPVAAALLIDPVDPADHLHLQPFGPLPDGLLPVPAILYLTGPATRHDRALARRWDCILAEGGDGPDMHTGTPGERHLARLRSLRDQLLRAGRAPQPDLPPVPDLPIRAAATQADCVAAASGTPPPSAAPARRDRPRAVPLPRILF